LNAAQGIAKYFSPIPRKPPKPRTAYAICPVWGSSTISLISPRLCPLGFSTSAPMSLLARYISVFGCAAKTTVASSKLHKASATAPVLVHCISVLLTLSTSYRPPHNAPGGRNSHSSHRGQELCQLCGERQSLLTAPGAAMPSVLRITTSGMANDAAGRHPGETASAPAFATKSET